ncbi:MAG: DUF3138 family protein, partial [Thiomonas sp.]
THWTPRKSHPQGDEIIQAFYDKERLFSTTYATFTAALLTDSGYNFTPRVLSFARFDYLNDSRNGGGLPGGVSGLDPINGFGPAPATCTLSNSGGLTGCTGNGANRYALSLGLNYLYTKSTTFKVEYRYDRANLATFQNVSDGSYKKDNNLLAASVVVSF